MSTTRCPNCGGEDWRSMLRTGAGLHLLRCMRCGQSIPETYTEPKGFNAMPYYKESNYSPIAFAILSADLERYTDKERGAANHALRDALQESPWDFQEVLGRYKDHNEVSYLVLLNGHDGTGLDGDAWDTVIKLARFNKQESVLYCNSDREAFLVYLLPDGVNKHERIGHWEEIQGYELAKQRFYTITPDGRYWVAK